MATGTQGAATSYNGPMHEKQRKILTECKKELVKDMCPEKVLLHFEDPHLFSEDEQDQITAAILTRQQQNEKLLAILKGKGAKAYDDFKKTIKKVHEPLFTRIVQAENKLSRSEPTTERESCAVERRGLRHSEVLSVEPHKADFSWMQNAQRPLSKHYHLQNAHSQGFEPSLTSTDDSRAIDERFARKQHFVSGKTSEEITSRYHHVTSEEITSRYHHVTSEEITSRYHHVSGKDEKPDTKRTENVKNLVQEPYQSFGRRQGGGWAPNRTESGSVAAGFRVDPEFRLPRHASKANMEPVLYNTDLFGREGAGAPKKIRSVQDKPQKGIGIDVNRSGAGAPNVDKNGNLKVRKGQTLTKSSNGQTIQRDFSPVNQRDVYYPFGKPGAGAPLMDPEGQIQTRTAGRLTHDSSVLSAPCKRRRRAKQKQLATLQEMSEETRQRRKAEHEDLLTSGKDCASWLQSGVVGQPSYDVFTNEIIARKKQTSDVTSQALDIRRQKNEKSREYHTDLEAQAQERYEHRKQRQEEQRVKSVEHFKTMDSMWGRPGAGAPRSRQAKKQKLGLIPAESSSTYRDS